MAINPQQLLDNIIIPTLQGMEMDSREARQLILGTIAVESNLGEYLVQVKGPAKGICQMEPTTYLDIWENYLSRRPMIVRRIKITCGIPVVWSIVQIPESHVMIRNPLYAVAMARIHYWRVSDPIPLELKGQAAYWKQHYNTKKGKGTVEKYIEQWNYFKLDEVDYDF